MDYAKEFNARSLSDEKAKQLMKDYLKLKKI